MAIICPECGHDNELDAVYCDECGFQLTPQSKPNSKAESEKEETASVNVTNSLSNKNETEESSTEKEPSIVTAENSEDDVEIKEEEEQEEEETKDSEEKEKFVSFPLSDLEKAPASVPMSTATRLELSEEEEELLQQASAPSPTVLQLSQAALIDPETETRFEFPTTKKTIYIGRANEELPVQIDLSDFENADIISRVHAAIHLEEEQFFLEDAGSINGTWLNGEKLRPGVRFRKKLASGDEIAFGKNQSIKLTFEKD